MSHVIMYPTFLHSPALQYLLPSPFFVVFLALILQPLPAEPQVVAISVCPTAQTVYTQSRERLLPNNTGFSSQTAQPLCGRAASGRAQTHRERHMCSAH